MINFIISWSLRNKLLVLTIASLLFLCGLYAVQTNTIDAIPDVSENQVIVYTEWTGRSPQIVEDQVTYPLVTQLQGLPGVGNVRGTSMFGMSFIYVIFDDAVDIYKARQLVLERLSSVAVRLPSGLTPQIGPDGTGVGHILWYTLEGTDMNPGDQRALQDWYVKLALQNVPGVSEVASFGGFEKQYEVAVDPNKLIYYGVSFQDVMQAIRDNNSETDGSKFEQSGIGYIVRTSGYLKSVADIASIAVRTINGNPVLMKDLGTIQVAGKSRFGIFDINGEGEAVGGIIVMRYGENANNVIKAVKAKMTEVAKGLPAGMRFNIVYDRSGLIEESVASVRQTLIEEMVMVSIVVLIFLFHWRSAVSILIQIPVTIAISFILLNAFGISSNIMSLTGIALAIGVISDNGIIMSENAYRNLARRQSELNTTLK